MAQMASFGARSTAAVFGGMVGFCLGTFLGPVFAGFLMGDSAGLRTTQVGSVLGIAAGVIGGAWLGLFLSGRPAVARWCLGTAAVVGGVSFLAGFAGPILLTPDLPQGPMLGIFITGPLGFLVGAIIGLGIGLSRE